MILSRLTLSLQVAHHWKCDNSAFQWGNHTCKGLSVENIKTQRGQHSGGDRGLLSFEDEETVWAKVGVVTVWSEALQSTLSNHSLAKWCQ